MPGCPPLISCLCHLFLLFSLDFEQAQSNRGKEEIQPRKWYSLSDWTPAAHPRSCWVKLVRLLYWRRSRKSIFLRYVKMNTHTCLPFGQKQLLIVASLAKLRVKGSCPKALLLFYFLKVKVNHWLPTRWFSPANQSIWTGWPQHAGLLLRSKLQRPAVKTITQI